VAQNEVRDDVILKGRIAIVTGAGSGIGAAGARMLAREGATVVAADRDADAGERTVHAIVQAGGSAMAMATDVGDGAALQRLIEGTLARFGRIDVLHSHAGIQVEGPLEAVDPIGMDASWEINVRAHFRLARLVMPAMRSQSRGSIIVTASNSGIFYDHEMIAYATSKHAAVAMVKQIAIDYGKFGVRVNALPGLGGHALQRCVHSPNGRSRGTDALHFRQGADAPLRERRRDRRSNPVSRLRPLVVYDGPRAGRRRRRMHRLNRFR